MPRDADDFEQLISDLHASVSGPGSATGDTGRIERWLRLLVDAGGSDLLLVAGAPPSLRVDGRIRPLADGADRRRRRGGSGGAGAGAARAAALSRRPASPTRPFACRTRAASASTCTANAVAPPPRCARCRRRCRAWPRSGSRPASRLLTRLPRGLVLVGGPTGSGKTTTLAALVDEINRRDARHIVTIEDPIEYEHAHHAGVVEQVEIGVDAPDFPTALRASLRQAPDVIVVGEMRDPETMRIALVGSRDGASRAVDGAHDRRGRRLSPASPTRFPTSGRIRSARSWRWRWRR